MPSRTKLDKSDEMIAERRQGTGKMPSDMPKWMSSTIINIDIGMNNIPLSPPPRLLLEYLNEYCLTENNYLQNKYGNTPLHIAAQYNIFYQIYKLCKPIVQKMAYVTNNIGKIPAETKSKLHFWCANC